MGVINDDMVVIANPTIPCRRLTLTIQEEVTAPGPITTEVEITGTLLTSVTITGNWQRCPSLDNTAG